MRKSRQLLNLPVFSLDEGRQIGKAKGLVIDPAQKAVVVLTIEERGWHKEQKFIPFSRLHSIGADAITVEKSSVVHKKSSLPDVIKLAKDNIEVIGTRLVLENGAILGQVDEYYIDLKTGEIGGLEFSEGVLNNIIQGRAYLDANFIRTLGKELTICTNDCLNQIVKIEGSLQDTVRVAKNTATQALSSALNKSRELGANINIPFRRKKNGEIVREQPAGGTVLPKEDDGPAPENNP